ncbi:hypothetical protein GCM10009700_29470 [Brevibacterium sanguinis]|uniref:recombinase family protein n=1 Tax=Brevibacterium sanguinis TaxID=232444 RepID=UPI0031E294F8
MRRLPDRCRWPTGSSPVSDIRLIFPEYYGDPHLDIARTYSDEAGARPELAQLLSDASAGRVSVVFVASLDRLGRTLPAAPQIMADFMTPA